MLTYTFYSLAVDAWLGDISYSGHGKEIDRAQAAPLPSAAFSPQWVLSCCRLSGFCDLDKLPNSDPFLPSAGCQSVIGWAWPVPLPVLM